MSLSTLGNPVRDLARLGKCKWIASCQIVTDTGPWPEAAPSKLLRTVFFSHLTNASQTAHRSPDPARYASNRPPNWQVTGCKASNVRARERPTRQNKLR